ncbi:MAG: hypothetical protein IPO85_12010 [Saprospiraceae bacterium]|uniref:Uncharacterized protein n=1 Tax=Candidatus Defluviibacterium haderslevense TaxID=2981993 RepID=A0A9D7SA77_9BACT|nr:hypothetical protein [Candidatus Defluviibacterium haderslevense]
MNTKHSSKIITKLNRDTKEGTIKWEVNRNKPSSLSGSEVLTDNVYTCKVLDKQFRLFKYQSKFYYDEGVYEWTDNFRLEFVDGWGNSEWAFPDNIAIYDLYETVRFKTSNIESFIDKF